MDDGGGPSEGFNPCECIWNHQLAMRRLLNALRNSQALCTDTECFEPGPASTNFNNSNENFYFMTFIIGMALLLYFIRPRPQGNETLTKPSNGNNSQNGPPPTPPID